jgi:triacylglycerol lipase
VADAGSEAGRLGRDLARRMGGVGRHTATAASRGLRSVASPAGLRGCGTEVAWLAAHSALYPLGVLAERVARPDGHRLDDLPPLQRGLVIGDVEAAGTPILLVHGMVDNRSVFTVLRRSLRRRGFGRVHTVNYSPLTSDVRAAARSLGRAVESLCEQTGYERVHVIAHSLGGVIARYHVQRLGGDARVHTLVTLGTPHGGTQAAHLLPLRLGRQLRPGSEIIEELSRPVYECRTRFVAIWSDLDQLVYPKRNARIEHPDLDVRNVPFRGIGHTSLPIHGGVAREVARTLAHLDPAGLTVQGPEPSGADLVTLRAHRRTQKDIVATPFG